MARPIDESLSYFPLDCDFYDDPKIIFVEEQFGIKGGYIANRLLCWIYRNGYYLKWDDDMALVFAKRVGNGITHALVNDVVNALVKRSFFDQGIFNSRSVLTSWGIQKRWLRVIAGAKRKAVINSLYEVVKVDLIELQQEETEPEPDETTQRKTKQSKEKKKRDISPPNSDIRLPTEISNPPPVAPPPSNGPTLEQVKSFFLLAGGTEEMAQAFWNKYEALDWRQGTYGTKIANWCPMANGYIATWRRNEKKDGTGKQTTTGSINAIDAATAQLLRDINATGGDE